GVGLVGESVGQTRLGPGAVTHGPRVRVPDVQDHDGAAPGAGQHNPAARRASQDTRGVVALEGARPYGAPSDRPPLVQLQGFAARGGRGSRSPPSACCSTTRPRAISTSRTSRGAKGMPTRVHPGLFGHTTGTELV